MGTPLWLRAFNAVETSVGPRVEEFVHGERFSASLALVQKVKRGVRGKAERRTRQVWHLVNLPAGSDVQRLRGQIIDLDHEVRHLRRSLEREQRSRTRHERSVGDVS